MVIHTKQTKKQKWERERECDEAGVSATEFSDQRGLPAYLNCSYVWLRKWRVGKRRTCYCFCHSGEPVSIWTVVTAELLTLCVCVCVCVCGCGCHILF